MESEMLQRFKAASMSAKGGLWSHPDVDYDKAQMSVQGLYRDMMSAVDYVGKGRTYTDLLEEERMEFVNQYLKKRKESLKDVSGQPVVKVEELEIKKA